MKVELGNVPLSAVDVLCYTLLVIKEHLDPDHGKNDIDFGAGGSSLRQ
jgi:hypothetical protein